MSTEATPRRVWLKRAEISGHMTWIEASGHDEGEFEFVSVDASQKVIAALTEATMPTNEVGQGARQPNA